MTARTAGKQVKRTTETQRERRKTRSGQAPGSLGVQAYNLVKFSSFLAALAVSLKPDTARLFFAAWPPPEVQKVLGDVARGLASACGGRAVPVRNVHLTLVFLGAVRGERVADLEALAATIAAPSFRLLVDRCGYWRHNRIVWAGPTRVPEALQTLVAGLESAIAAADFRFDRRPYVPHVTLLRGARRPPPAADLPPVAWSVPRFALVESVARSEGRRYQVLRDWPLGA
jgi:2'-5' RNA ligase